LIFRLKTESKINASNRISALKAERDAILSYLQGGFQGMPAFAA
jgi:hypothetical protein